MDEIKRTQLRTRAYGLSDGIIEMVAGTACLLTGIGFLLAAWADSDALRWLSLAAWFALALLSAVAIRILKNRITHRRTGYIKYPKPVLPTGQRFLLNLVVILITTSIFHEYVGDAYAKDGPMEGMLLLGWAILIAMPFVIGAVRLRTPRLLAIAAAIVIASLAAWLYGLDRAIGVGLVFASGGAGAVLTGTPTLAAYIRRHPKFETEVE